MAIKNCGASVIGLVLTGLITSVHAQPTFSSTDLTPPADGAYTVFAADLDADGDADLISGSFGDWTVCWHENNGEVPPSFTAIDVFTDPDRRVYSVFAADLDGDGDTDIVSANGTIDGRLRWLENEGGSPPTFTAHLIDDYRYGGMNPGGPRTALRMAVFAADMDGFSIFGAAFGATAGDDSYDPVCDFNADGPIDLGDFSRCSQDFERTECGDDA